MEKKSESFSVFSKGVAQVPLRDSLLLELHRLAVQGQHVGG